MSSPPALETAPLYVAGKNSPLPSWPSLWLLLPSYGFSLMFTTSRNNENVVGFNFRLIAPALFPRSRTAALCGHHGLLWRTEDGEFLTANLCFSSCVQIVGLWVLLFRKQKSVLQIFISEMKRSKVTFYIKLNNMKAVSLLEDGLGKTLSIVLFFILLTEIETVYYRRERHGQEWGGLESRTGLRFKSQFYNPD